MLVLGACAGWALLTAAAHGGRPEGVLLAVLAATAGHAVGRVSGALLPVAAPCGGALAALALAVAHPDLAPGPWYATPLGHADGTAALLALATGAACCAAWAAPAPASRRWLWALAAGTAPAGAALGSAAGCAVSTAVLLCAAAAGPVTRRGLALLGLAPVAGLAAAATWALAAGALPDGLTGVLDGRLTAHRVGLWQDAVRLAVAHPGLGIGPDRFGELSPASASVSSDGKPHSALLQTAAEQGLVGVVLGGAVFCWVLCALWRTPRSTPVALTAGAALTALAVLASVGDTLSFTSVTAGAGLLAGWATARPWACAGAESRR